MADRFFQTTSSLEGSQRKADKAANKNGNPVKLPSKILFVAADPAGGEAVYVTESTGTLRRVNLETGKVSATYRGPTAPLTSIAFSADGATVFAGCWDKTIWSWAVGTRQAGMRYVGHKDFVKAVVCVRLGLDEGGEGTEGKDEGGGGRGEVLVSGGADAELIVWDMATGARRRVIKQDTRGIQALAIDPASASASATSPALSPLTLFSASSDRTIRLVRLGGESDEQSPPESPPPLPSQPIVEHHTSVYALVFDEDGDLWTASADRTARCLARVRGWATELVLEHPDFVRDVAVYEAGGLVVTACRDEGVRVWNRATGDLHHIFTGHYEEVTGLTLVGQTVVSVSIDGTVRRWPLDAAGLARAREAAAVEAAGVEEEDKAGPGEGEGNNVLTEEEERELAELMDE